MDKININAVDATQSREGAVEALLGVDINGEVRRTNITKLDTYSKSEIDSKDDAIKQYTDLQISALIGGATPESLNTLSELAAALEEEGDAIVAINSELSTKYGPSNKPTATDVGLSNYTNSPIGRFGSVHIKGKNGGYTGITFDNNRALLMGDDGTCGVFTNDGSDQWAFRGDTLTSGKVPWARIPDAPATATRWPTAAEAGALPVNTLNGTPAAAYFTSPASSKLGIKVRLPYLTNSSKMVCFTVRLYQGYNFYDIQFSGYLYSTTNQWYEPKAIMISGTSGLTVTMGKDTDGQAYVWLAGGSYKGVGVFNVVGGYDTADWNTGWTITETDERPNAALNVFLSPPFSPTNKPTPVDVGLGSILGSTNNAYGTVSVLDQKNGWAGIEFPFANANLMGNKSASGWFDYSIGGWKWLFEDGTLTAGKVPWSQIVNQPVQATRWPTPAEVGALPLSGGNINGPLVASSVIRSGSQVRGFGTGNTYVSAGLETGATTSDPSISFHREGHYAATLRLINPDSFGFLNQANSAYCDLTVKDLAATSNISVGGGISINQVDGLGKGLSLYGAPMNDPNYGVMFAQIATFGGHGAVNGDWATYFNIVGGGNRGWIFRYKGVKNAASISCNGDIHASSVTVNNIATGDLSISRNVGATGDVHAKSFYGNANIAGTGTAVNCPSGIYSQGTNWLYGPIITSNNSVDTGSGAVTCGNVTANGVIRGHSFIGDGYNLIRLDWNKLINKPNVANDWINIFNGGINGRVNKVNIPPQMLNHLKAGRMVEVRAFLNHQGRAGSNRKTMTSIIDGADGWVSYVNDKVSHDMTWYGISAFYVLNASSQHGGDANSFKSQHQNITRIDMRLL